MRAATHAMEEALQMWGSGTREIRTCVIPGDSPLLSGNHEAIWQVFGLLILQKLVDWIGILSIDINLVLQSKTPCRLTWQLHLHQLRFQGPSLAKYDCRTEPDGMHIASTHVKLEYIC